VGGIISRGDGGKENGWLKRNTRSLTYQAATQSINARCFLLYRRVKLLFILVVILALISLVPNGLTLTLPETIPTPSAGMSISAMGFLPQTCLHIPTHNAPQRDTDLPHDLHKHSQQLILGRFNSLSISDRSFLCRPIASRMLCWTPLNVTLQGGDFKRACEIELARDGRRIRR